MPVQFQCDECGRECISDRDEDEARKEAEEIFNQPSEGMAIVCEDCWNKLKGQFEL